VIASAGVEAGNARDFLKTDAKTPLRGVYLAAGVRLTIETNSDFVLRMAQDSFEPVRSEQRIDPGHAQDVGLRLWIEETADPDEPPKSPYFRGLGALVFSGYSRRSSLLINLKRRYGAGRFTSHLASDAAFWKTVFFPSFLAIVGPAAGLTPLHAACVSWQGRGVILAGDSGAGKSTLSLALAQAGFDFLSDDRVLIGWRSGLLSAWGPSPDAKLTRESRAYFPALENLEDEPSFRFDPVESMGIHRAPSCEPQWIFFLDRRPDAAFSLHDIGPEEAALLLQRGLHRETEEIAEQQRRTIRALTERRRHKLCYGGDPHAAARALRLLLVEGRRPLGTEDGAAAPPAASVLSSSRPPGAAAAPPDPLRRFRPLPLQADLLVMGRSIRLETDNTSVLKHAVQVLAPFRNAAPTRSHFLWRIACEPHETRALSWPPLAAFSSGALRYVNIGRRGFIAVDLEAREAAGVLPERLADDAAGFCSVFLASMFYLTAPALGLTAISASCVAKDGKGLLIFGPPNSGKTTSSYCAAKLGMRFHADQSSFLELESGIVRAWGDFWPAAFRPDAARFLPELLTAGQTFSYLDQTFLCIDKNADAAISVPPAACVFLERRADALPKLIPLPAPEARELLAAAPPFRDDAAPNDDVLDALNRLPSYRLVYGDDPNMAALFFRSVLNTHAAMEARQ